MKALLRKIRQILKDRRTRRFLTRFVSGIAAVVVFVTTYALVLPAITMESQAACGIEAHQHDDSCYSEKLICGQEESEGHHHTDDCYTVTRELECDLEEHQHSSENGCFDEEGNLLCKLEEHTHADSCYKEHRELTCGLEETEGHHHTDSCYEKVLTCGKEAHTHSAACYKADLEIESAAVASTGMTSAAAVPDFSDNDYAAEDSKVDSIVSESPNEEDADDTIVSGDNSENKTQADSEADIKEKNTDHNDIKGESGDADKADEKDKGKDKTDSEEGEEAASSFSTGFAADEDAENEDAYIPDKDALDFYTVLNGRTGIYYHHVAEDEEIEDSSAITDWTSADEDTELNPGDIIRVYLSYTLPKDTINATNDISRYRLPDTLHLTDDQIEAINSCENGISAQYIDYDNLEITDPERHTAYLGLESVEGSRLPGQELKEDGQEYISAVVRAEKIYDEDSGEYEGTDLIFTFSPYAVEKNAHAYDKKGQPTRAGEEVTGWLTLDFNMGQIDWVEDKTSEIVFAEEDKENDISEIKTVLKQADPANAETDDSAVNGTTEAAAEYTTDEAAAAATTAEIAAEDSTEAAAAETAAAAAATTSETASESNSARADAGTQKDSESEKDKNEKITAASYPAAVFDDSITVRSGRLDTDLADTELPKKTKMIVHVEADEGTFPEGTRMVLSAVEDLDAVAEAVGTAVDAKTRGFQAVDITFYDKDPSAEDAKEIQPLKPIRVAIKSDEIKKAAEDSSTAPVVVHIEDDNTATEIENTASKTDSGTIEIEKPGVEADPIDSGKDSDADTGSTDQDSDKEVATGDDAAQTNTADEETEPDAPNNNRDSKNTEISEPQQENTGAETDNDISDQDNTNVESDSNHNAESSIDSSGLSENQSDSSRESNEKDMPEGSIVESADTSAEDNDSAAEDASESETGAQDTGAGDTVNFEADSFSVYAIVYTVDFHWEVNGKQYQLSLPGGGFVSFEALMEIMGVANKGAEENKETEAAEQIITSDNQTDSDAEMIPTAGMLTVNDIQISEETKAFVEDVESVVFSSPELVWVGKVDTDGTVGGLKEANRLECQYSAVLTEEQIADINAQTVKAGDWALISVQPFESEETLTVTMKDGEQFVVKVTDAQDPVVFDGKEVIIYDNTDKRAMLSTGYDYGNNNGYRLDSVPVSEADGNQAAHWKVESTNGGYYLRNNGGYLRLENNSARVVSNQNQATVFYIQAGNNPDYCIQDASNNNNKLTYSNNAGTGYNGFFSGQNNTSGSTQQWLYIREVQEPIPQGGDWMLYFDDDFSDKEITIHVGETITLRPYDKWEWKEGTDDVQTYHWNVGGTAWNDWTITSSDSTGDRYGTTTDGPFEFTRFVKEDNQLNTHYWSVQGRATQIGTYTLTNTKNNKTITVRVVDGDPVNKPNTINSIANIKVNLFDYDKNGLLDPDADNNLANNSNNKNDSVNQMGGSNHFYFLSSGSGNNNNEPWNNYTKDDRNPNIVLSTLGTDGYPVLNHGNSNTSLKYLFDASQTSWHGGNNNDGMIAYPDVVGMFRKDSNGYYYFNSNTNYFYYDTATGTSKLYEHTYTQVSKSDGRVNDKPIGFFPFHDYDATDDLYVNQNSDLNHHLGLSMELEFMLPANKLDDNNQPIIFDFSGDDDLWVFVEWEDDNGVKHSQLLLDLGGVHQPIHGAIDFTAGTSTTGQDASFIQPNRPYILKVFYLERGGCDSNCSIRFNLPIVQDLTVAKKLTGLTEDEKIKYKDEKFTYEIVVNGHPYNYPNPNNRYEKAVLRDAAGNDITPANFTIVNGRVNIKDGQTLTITYLDRSDQFSVAELNTSNMANFEVPNAERYYHKEKDASLYEEEIELTVSQTLSDPVTADWVTETYKLEDTEKVTFTNTLKEKNLEVEKKWKGNKEHPNNITFTVSATVDDGHGGRIPYAVAELKEENASTGEIIDKVFTLDNGNDWRQAIEHLPVNTPDGKFIFYDINEGHVDGYVLTGSVDITAEHYNYCNVDVVKLWPDSNGGHTEVIRVVLQNSAGKYYAGVDSNGEAIFVDDISDAIDYDLTSTNNFTHRFARLPARDSAGDPEKYTAVQLNQDAYTEGLATYTRNIIQYQLENTPIEGQVDPQDKPNNPVIHKRIDALRDGVTNPEAHADEDLTDLYRLYLDYKINSLQEANGVDLLFVIDHSGSMNNSEWPGNQYRASSVMSALNGADGFISKFLAENDKNRWAAVGYKGPDGSKDYTWALTNPWQPGTEAALTNAGQNGSEVLSPGSTFTRDSANIALPNEGSSILSNYTAGFWRAEQFLLNQEVKEDGRKKVIVFITDGVPTLHIDNLNRTLQGAGTAAGSPYYHEENGGCPAKALTEFGYFVTDMTNYGYVFGSNVEFYTVGLGTSMQTDIGLNLMDGMLDAAYGDSDHTGYFMTITDANSNIDDSVTNTLTRDLRIILGMNETFSDLVIEDDLSKYVDLYGLADAGSSASSIMIAAKAKVTMTVPGPSGASTITLYENGAPATSEDAKFTKANGDKATIIQELTYDAATKTVRAVFNPEYHPAPDVVYTLSFDVKATDEAYTTFAADGYDKYTSGEHQGQVIIGDPDTDFLGTTPANATSVNKEGFRSNDEAKATYTHNNKPEEQIYPHPVIQVAAKIDIVKIDQTGAALEGAKFNLYDGTYDPSKTIEENAGSLIEADLQSKKPAGQTGGDAVIRSGKLTVGTYYLVETKAPDGYNSLPGPVKITVSETNGSLTMTAEIAGQAIGPDKLEPIGGIGSGVWKLSLQNSAGYELPHTGGPGTKLFTILGAMLLVLAAAGMAFMKTGLKKRRF